MNQYVVIESWGASRKENSQKISTHVRLAFFLGSSAWPDMLAVSSLKLLTMVSSLLGVTQGFGGWGTNSERAVLELEFR